MFSEIKHTKCKLQTQLSTEMHKLENNEQLKTNSHFSLQNQSFLSVNFFLLVKILFIKSLKSPATNWL